MTGRRLRRFLAWEITSTTNPVGAHRAWWGTVWTMRGSTAGWRYVVTPLSAANAALQVVGLRLTFFGRVRVRKLARSLRRPPNP